MPTSCIGRLHSNPSAHSRRETSPHRQWQSKYPFALPTIGIGTDPTWNNVRLLISSPEDTANADLSTVRGCFFIESVVLAPQQGSCAHGSGVSLPCCIDHSSLKNTTVFPHCCMLQNALIENTVILSNTIVMGCGRITCQRTSSPFSSSRRDYLRQRFCL